MRFFKKLFCCFVWLLVSISTQAQASHRAISQLQVGDGVLAIAEWKDKGSEAKLDQRLSYEKVTDIFTSFKEQTLIHLTLANGEQLTATEGHPFKTVEGWRDAVMLKKGGKLLLKGGEEDSEPALEITEIRTERKTLPVYNIEVANAHTYFVGIDGVVVHNAGCPLGRAGQNAWLKRAVQNSPGADWALQFGYQNGLAHSGVRVIKNGNVIGSLELQLPSPGAHDASELFQNTMAIVKVSQREMLDAIRMGTEDWFFHQRWRGRSDTWSCGVLCHEYTEYLAEAFAPHILNSAGKLNGPWSATGLGRFGGDTLNYLIGAPVDLYMRTHGGRW
jgi:hypothetical protein